MFAPNRHILSAILVGSSLALAATPSTVTVSLDPQIASIEKTIPSYFFGLSFEKDQMRDGLLKSPGTGKLNSSLVNLFKRLGPGVFRIGANKVDYCHWNPNKTSNSSTDTLIPDDLRRLKAFLDEVNWKIIYAVPMAGNGKNEAAKTPTKTKDLIPSAVSEADSAIKIFGNRLIALEIGNEIDHYADAPSGSNPSGGPLYPDYNGSKIQPRWDSIAKAIIATNKNAPLSGPGCSGTSCALVSKYATSEPVMLLTSHHYGAWNRTSPPNTIAELLDSGNSVGLSNVMTGIINIATKSNLPYRMTETNSINGGGVEGISNSAGSALWAIEYMFTLVSSGVTGVNFHTGGSQRYAAFHYNSAWSVTEVLPVFYGYEFFTDLSSAGSVKVAKATVSAPHTLQAWSARRSDGSLVIVLTDTSNTPFTALVQPGSGFKSATSFVMTAPNLQAKTGMTLGGATILTGGTTDITPKSTPLTFNKSGNVSVTVPGASAVMLSFAKTSTSVMTPFASNSNSLVAYGRKLTLRIPDGTDRAQLEIRSPDGRLLEILPVSSKEGGAQVELSHRYNGLVLARLRLDGSTVSEQMILAP